MAYKLFDGKDTLLVPTTEETASELIKIAQEVNYPLGTGVKRSLERGDGVLSSTYPNYMVDGAVCRTFSNEYQKKSLNEFVTELYKYKKSKENGV